ATRCAPAGFDIYFAGPSCHRWASRSEEHLVRYCPRKRLSEHTCLLVAFVSAAVILYSADGSVEDAKYALGNLLGRLQVWLPCVHRYAKVWICVRAPEITRVEPYSIEPLWIFPLAKCVGVREDVAAM